jgi:hypothetical protein
MFSMTTRRRPFSGNVCSIKSCYFNSFSFEHATGGVSVLASRYKVIFKKQLSMTLAARQIALRRLMNRQFALSSAAF